MGKTYTMDDREIMIRIELLLLEIESNNIINPDALKVIELTRLVLRTAMRGQQSQAFRALNTVCFDVKAGSTNRIKTEGERRLING